MPVSDLAAIHIGLARFAGAVYPDDLEHVDAVLAACTEVRAAMPSAIRNSSRCFRHCFCCFVTSLVSCLAA